MGLMQCPECNKDVSEKAKVCPHCGFPLEMKKTYDEGLKVPPSVVKSQSASERSTEYDKYGIWGFVLALVSAGLPIAVIDIIIGIVAFVFSMVCISKASKNRGLAIAGIVISVLAVLGAFVLLMEAPEFYYF